MHASEPNGSQRELSKALAEIERLKEENERLKKLLEIRTNVPGIIPASNILAPASVTTKSSTQDKIRLFRNLFRGRDDVYAVHWEGKNGKSGYSPACIRDARNFFTSKAEAIEQRRLLPLTDQVIHDHLSGKITAGIYLLLKDETCWFLAIDFDKTTWTDDVSAFLQVCPNWAIPACLERSRSGKGAHIWIFFEQPIPALLARKMGAAILTRTMEQWHHIGLDSYDRMFPNQDTLPKGGFGNLIALPLQHVPRTSGNSVFLSDNFQPHEDQWSFLASIQRMGVERIRTIVDEA